MNAIRAQEWKKTADNLVYSELRHRAGGDGISVNDLTVNAGLRRGTVTAALKRLEGEKLVQRIWDGNKRFGRFLYFCQRES
jgi:DNA-binding MarR family transcriptional regulator